MPKRGSDTQQQYRRKMWISLAIVAVVGGLILFGFNQWLHRFENNPTGLQADALMDRLQWINRLIQLAIVGVLIALGMWLHKLAAAAKVQKRWPPSMVESTDAGKAESGEKALKIAGIVSIMALTSLCAAGIVFIRMVWQMVF